MSERRVAISHLYSRPAFLTETPANLIRGVETTRDISLAKADFADQDAIDSYVEARGGTAGEWLLLDLSAAGVT